MRKQNVTPRQRKAASKKYPEFTQPRRAYLRPDGRRGLPGNEHYLDEVCPHRDCGAVFGREQHTGDCKATVLREVWQRAVDRVRRWKSPLVLFKMPLSGRWHMAEESWWKERLRFEIPVSGAVVLTYTFRFENGRVVAKRHEDRVTSAEVKKALVDAGADGDCDHGVPFDEPCDKCDKGISMADAGKLFAEALKRKKEKEIEDEIHRAETDVEFPRGRC